VSGFGGAEEAGEGELIGEFLKVGHGRVVDEGCLDGRIEDRQEECRCGVDEICLECSQEVQLKVGFVLQVSAR
jgi:hypothetical protein